jgi:hypothetical protein
LESEEEESEDEEEDEEEEVEECLVSFFSFFSGKTEVDSALPRPRPRPLPPRANRRASLSRFRLMIFVSMEPRLVLFEHEENE